MKVGIEIGVNELAPPLLDDPVAFKSVGPIFERFAIAVSSSFRDTRRCSSEVARAVIVDA